MVWTFETARISVPGDAAWVGAERGRAGMDTQEPTQEPTQAAQSEEDRDAQDLGKFGYKQELKRTLGLFSSFAVAFSYISPSTGIFTLFYLAITIGGAMFWTWPVVALGQFI